mgnify:CR=1 FL=1
MIKRNKFDNPKILLIAPEGIEIKIIQKRGSKKHPS